MTLLRASSNLTMNCSWISLGGPSRPTNASSETNEQTRTTSAAAAGRATEAAATPADNKVEMSILLIIERLCTTRANIPRRSDLRWGAARRGTWKDFMAFLHRAAWSGPCTPPEHWPVTTKVSPRRQTNACASYNWQHTSTQLCHLDTW